MEFGIKETILIGIALTFVNFVSIKYLVETLLNIVLQTQITCINQIIATSIKYKTLLRHSDKLEACFRQNLFSNFGHVPKRYFQ